MRTPTIRLPRPALWALVFLLMAIFVRAGTTKLVGPAATRWAERFADWGYPAGAAAWIGILEIVSALALLIPKTRRAAAAIIVALMIGALATHLVHGELPRLIPPLVLGGFAFLVYTARK